jgi:predicted metal-dependent hydrolase
MARIDVRVNSDGQLAARLGVHLDQVPHGTTPAEQVVIAAAVEHLESTDTNPHGLSVDDLDVYTKAQVDALLAPRQIFSGGGI